MSRGLNKFATDENGALDAFDADIGKPVQADFEKYVDEFGDETMQVTVSFTVAQGVRNRVQRRRAAARNRRAW